MKLKSKISMILSILIILSSFSFVSLDANALGDPKFIMEADKKVANVGDKIKVTLKVSDIEKFSGYQASIKYTGDIKPVFSDGDSYEDSSMPESGNILVNKKFSPTELVKNEVKDGVLNFGRSYMALSAFKAAGSAESTGELCYIYFEVMKEGNASISLENSSSMASGNTGTMVFDWDGAQIQNYSVENPRIDIICNAVATPTTTKIAATATPTQDPNQINANGTATIKPTSMKSTPTSSSYIKSSDAKITPTPKTSVEPKNSDKPAIVASDISISISADKRVYKEGDVITYTIKYKNNLSNILENVNVQAKIPEYTQIESDDKNVTGNSINWNINRVEPGKIKGLTYSVKVLSLDSAQKEVLNTADVMMASKSSVISTSNVKVLLTSDNFDKILHKSYVNGYKGNKFKPNNNITRAEAATMFANLLELDTEDSESVYKDVNPKNWAAKSINAVSKKGIFKGDKGKFSPDAYITRAQMATAIARYLELSEEEPIEVHFKDIGKHWAKKYIEEIYRVKITSGYGDKFLPENKITRAEAVTMLNKMLYRGPLAVKESSFNDVPSKNWAVGQIEEASKEHFCTRDKDGNEVLK